MLIIRPLIDFLSGGFESFAKIKLSSSNDSLGRLEVYDPHQRLFMFALFSSYQLNGLCGSWVGVKEGILASHNIAKSKTGPQGDASHTL